MPALFRSVLAASLLPCVLAIAPAAAQSPGELRSQHAQAQLSARYTQLWAQMPAAQRAPFGRSERQWLHVTRWEEQQRCVAAHAAASQTTAVAEQAEIAAACLAAVTLQRLRSLPGAALAAR